MFIQGATFIPDSRVPETFQMYDFDNFSEIKWQSLQISVKIMSVK